AALVDALDGHRDARHGQRAGGPPRDRAGRVLPRKRARRRDRGAALRFSRGGGRPCHGVQLDRDRVRRHVDHLAADRAPLRALKRSYHLRGAVLDEVDAARRAELKNDVDLGARVPRRSVEYAERQVVLAIDGEGLKWMRDGLPDIGAVHQPGPVRVNPGRRVTLEVRREENRAADATLWRRGWPRHEVAIKIDLERVGVPVDVDLLERRTGLGRKTRRRSARAAGAAAGGDQHDERDEQPHAYLTLGCSGRFPE